MLIYIFKLAFIIKIYLSFFLRLFNLYHLIKILSITWVFSQIAKQNIFKYIACKNVLPKNKTFFLTSTQIGKYKIESSYV